MAIGNDIVFWHPLGTYRTELERKELEARVELAAIAGAFFGALAVELFRSPPPPVKKAKRRGRK